MKSENFKSRRNNPTRTRPCRSDHCKSEEDLGGEVWFVVFRGGMEGSKKKKNDHR